MPEAIDRALAEHPRRARDDAEVRRRGRDVRTARDALLPDLDLSAELHRGTGNVVPGTQLPLTGVPTVAGPPSAYRFDGGVWGSGIGLAARYDVAAIAGSMRDVDRAVAAQRGVAATRDLDRLDIAVRVGAAYLDALEAKAHRRTADAFVDRSAALVRQAEALAAAELQPQAEVARARAELASANALAATAAAREDEALARLAAAMGTPDADVDVVADLEAWSGGPDRSPASTHPALAASTARFQQAEARRRAAALRYLPRVELVAALWARGSGFAYPRAFDAGGTGVVADAGNWVVGISMTLPLLDLPAVAESHRAAKDDVAIAKAERDEIELELRASIRQADIRRNGARKVAATTPAQVEAAKTSLDQATARYEAGLGRFLDVQDASRMLAQAQEADERARIDVARAELLRARARGDLGPLLGRAPARERR